MVLDLEIWLFFLIFINILLVSPLRFFKVKYKLSSNIRYPHGSNILDYWIHGFMHT
jgi:hypothetical protein